MRVCCCVYVNMVYVCMVLCVSVYGVVYMVLCICVHDVVSSLLPQVRLEGNSISGMRGLCGRLNTPGVSVCVCVCVSLFVCFCEIVCNT